MAQKGKKLWGKYLQSTIRRIKIIFQVSAIRTTRLCPAMSGKFSHTAKEAVGALTKSKIVNGMDFNHFVPNGLSTRAEAAKVVYGLLML